MEFASELIESRDGFAICCPALPGSWSQGETREEALTDISEALAICYEVSAEDHGRELADDGIRFHRGIVSV